MDTAQNQSGHRHHDDRRDRHRDSARTRSRSPRDRDRHRHRGDRDRERDRSERDRKRRDLPHAARHLISADRAMFAPLLAHYLLTERGVAVANLPDDEKASRWKRFVDRWNHRGLADQWYEPQLFLRVARGGEAGAEAEAEAESQVKERGEREESQSDDDSDDYGPALPPPNLHQKAGATLPTMDDLRERRELVDDDRRAQRSADRAADRLVRKADRTQERDRLDELVPRAAAGTRERQLEKKRALNDTLRSFRDPSPGTAEVDDSELMGGGSGKGGNDVDAYKRMLAATQKKKTEWEVRREEEQRARLAELDERRAQYRAREAETVAMLRVLARQRFG